jgi:hypothetical protein
LVSKRHSIGVTPAGASISRATRQSIDTTPPWPLGTSTDDCRLAPQPPAPSVAGGPRQREADFTKRLALRGVFPESLTFGQHAIVLGANQPVGRVTQIARLAIGSTMSDSRSATYTNLVPGRCTACSATLFASLAGHLAAKHCLSCRVLAMKMKYVLTQINSD